MIMDPQPGEVSMILWFWWFVVGALCISEKERIPLHLNYTDESKPDYLNLGAHCEYVHARY
jgi:hypothetical protein